MSTVNTVNYVKELNNKLTPITVYTDAERIELPTLTYRERIALTTQLLLSITEHPHSARHQAASAATVIGQMALDSNHNLHAETAEDERIERELKEQAEAK